MRLDAVVAGVYGAVPHTAAVCTLLDHDCLRPLAPGAPGAASAPRPVPSRMTRYVQGIKAHWATRLHFPNPLQALLLALGVGCTFILSGDERFAAPIYGGVREFGGDTSWGLGFLAVTVAMVLTWRFWRRGLFVAYVMAGAGYLLLALSFAQVAWTDPTVSWLAAVMTAWLAWVHAMAAKRVSGEWPIERWVRDHWQRK